MMDTRLVADNSTVADRLRFIERLASKPHGDPQAALDAVRHHAEMALLKLDISKAPPPPEE